MAEMEIRQNRRKYIWLVAILLIIAAGYTFYRVKKSDFLVNKLPSLVNDKTNSLYTVSYDSIFVNEADGNLFIKNLVLKADTLKQLDLIAKNDTNAVSMLLDISIPQLEVQGFKTAKALLSKRLDCNKIIITNPVINIAVFPGQKKPKETQEQQKEFYKQILGNLKLIKAQEVNIINATVSAYDFHSKERKIQGNNTSINLLDVAVDSTYNQDTSRIFFCKEIRINIDKGIIGDKSNTADVSGLAFDTKSKIISIASFDYDSFKNKGFFKTSLRGIQVLGADYNGPVEDATIKISSIVINSAELESLSSNQSSGDKSKNEKILTGWIKSFSLDKFNVKSFAYIAQSTNKKGKPLTLKNNALLVKNVKIDRLTTMDKGLIEKAGEIDISNDEINITSPDGMYAYQFKDVRLNSRQKKAYVQSIKVKPLLSEEAFAKKAHYQTDRYSIDFKNVVCSGIDFGRMIKQDIQIDNITNTNSVVKVFRDLSYPIDSAKKTTARDTYPHQLLHKLTISIAIRKFEANNLYLEYKEKNPLSKASGRLRFSNSNLVIKNIANAPAKPGEKMTASFTTTFMEKVPMKGSFSFFSDQWKKGKFSAAASVDKPIDATILNELTQPMSLARIEKGTINRINFRTVADTSVSNGHLEFNYEDLKISLLKKKGVEYDKKSIMSLLANVLVKNKNEQSPDMRVADVKVKRNIYKSFFNFIWMTIFTGMRDVLVLKV